ncbi:ATP-binding domain-containing protein [bacterium]|nr:ATP-binding domain-containing protein [bacterium]
MSLHKSKGLTSKVTIVAGCIQGLIPMIDDTADLLEQRRLFYVAITRAKEILLLSSFQKIERDLAHNIGAKIIGRGGAYGDTISSEFLGQLGPETPTMMKGLDWKNNGYKLE